MCICYLHVVCDTLSPQNILISIPPLRFPFTLSPPLPCPFKTLVIIVSNNLNSVALGRTFCITIWVCLCGRSSSIYLLKLVKKVTHYFPLLFLILILPVLHSPRCIFPYHSQQFNLALTESYQMFPCSAHDLSMIFAKFVARTTSLLLLFLICNNTTRFSLLCRRADNK